VLFIAPYLEQLGVRVKMLKYLCLPLRHRDTGSTPTDYMGHDE
jgi:hypothetical protein